jgi:signal transduction histidine kinase
MQGDLPGVVSGRIIQVHSSGIRIETASGELGYVPRRELTWELVPPHPVRNWRVGQAVTAAWNGDRTSAGDLLLSVRQTGPDPWQTAVEKYELGQVVRGQVFSLFDRGAYFEIEPGVPGLIYVDRLGPEQRATPEDWVGIGDVVRAEIVAVNHDHRNFLCDQRARLQRLRGQQPSGAVQDEALAADLITPSGEAESKDYYPGRMQVLLIDDEQAFCRSAEREFGFAGHSLQGCQSAEDGIRRAIDGDFDIIAIDFVLSEMNGAEVCRRIRDGRPDSVLVIFTGEEGVDPDLLTGLEPRPLVLRKPFGVEDLEAAYFGEVRSPAMVVPELRPAEDALASSKRIYEDHPNGPYELLVEETETAAARADAWAWGAFEWLDHEQRLLVHRIEGFSTTDAKKVEYDVNYSFVRNVAETGREVWIDRFSAASTGIKNWASSLRKWVDFESLICLPVFVKGQPRFALLLVSLDAGAFFDDFVGRLRTRAELLGAKVEAWEAYGQLERIQGLAMRGQLTASLTHELRNRLATLDLSLRSAARLALDEGTLRSLSEAEYGEFAAAIRDATMAAERFGDVVSAFSEGADERGLVAFDVARLVQTVATRLGPQARRLRVVLDTSHVVAPLVITSSPARLGQVIENLILNGLQQTSLHRPHGGGRVWVAARFVEERDRRYVHIRVRDNGPGVHADDYERIFEMGYTTKPQGMGVGLALCKATTASLGGTVAIGETVVFEGTTMLVRLPAFEVLGGDAHE